MACLVKSGNVSRVRSEGGKRDEDGKRFDGSSVSMIQSPER